MRLPLLPFAFLLLLAPAAAQPVTPTSDTLAEALATVGFTRDDLGYRPKGYWNRYPDPVTTPFKLRAFDDLFAEPLMTYDYTRTMANAVGRYMSPTDENNGGPDSLYHLVYSVGVDRLMGGFRNYSPNLTRQPDTTTPLKSALQAAYRYGGRDLENPTFGASTVWPAEGSPDAAMLASVPLELQTIVGRALLNMIEAAEWRDLALRNCDGKDLAKVFAIRDLGTTQGDGQVFYPEVEDVAESMDWQSMGYCWLKTCAAAGHLKAEAKAWLDAQPVDDQLAIHFDMPTPMGRVVITGMGNDEVTGDPVALWLDLGGNDGVMASVGSTATFQMPVAIGVDLGGYDAYETASHGLGCGILGAGVLWDSGDGNNSFSAKSLALGAGQFGCGVLRVDGGEYDYFAAESSAMGAGYLGIGLLADAQGDDNHSLAGGEGLGFGGIGGIGVLADLAGKDLYYAEPGASKAPGRADYHSDFAINVSNAMGVGSGRRGDGSDGHAWAGGLGAIIDLDGDDRYEAGNFSLGTGYWYGIGVMWDGAGNDVYDSVYFTQASGAHYCIGAIFDEGAGNDTHLLGHNAGAALGFGWDYTDAIFLDSGGDDHYSAKLISYGCANIRSNAFFFELGGNDTYEFQAGLLGFGATDWRDDYAATGPMSPYNSYASSIGVFLDLGGADKYVPFAADPNAPLDVMVPMMDNSSWQTPMPGDPHYGWNNFGVGVDREGGSIWELERWQENP